MAIRNSIFNHPEFANLVDLIKKEVEKATRPPEQIIYDDVDLRNILKVSERTTAYWRSKGKITFSKICGKIYYRLSDILAFLKEHEVPAVASNLKIQL